VRSASWQARTLERRPGSRRPARAAQFVNLDKDPMEHRAAGLATAPLADNRRFAGSAWLWHLFGLGGGCKPETLGHDPIHLSAAGERGALWAPVGLADRYGVAIGGRHSPRGAALANSRLFVTTPYTCLPPVSTARSGLRCGWLSGDTQNWSGGVIENWSPQAGGEDGIGLDGTWLPGAASSTGGADADARGGCSDASAARSRLGIATDCGAAWVQPDDGKAVCLGGGMARVPTPRPAAQVGGPDSVAAGAADPPSRQCGRGAPGPGA
jgi:hypothetical protein